jgi:hypothetical protein
MRSVRLFCTLLLISSTTATVLTLVDFAGMRGGDGSAAGPVGIVIALVGLFVVRPRPRNN